MLTENNEVEYCGRTDDLDRRKKEHEHHPFKGKLKFEPLIDNITYDQSRIEEQICIEVFDTLNYTETSNKRNGIGIKSPLYGLFYNVYYLHEDLYNHQTFVGKGE